MKNTKYESKNTGEAGMAAIWWVYVLAVVGLITLGIWATIEDEKQWQRYGTEHNCTITGRKESSTSVGVGANSNGGVSVVPVFNPEQKIYKCDNEEIIIRIVDKGYKTGRDIYIFRRTHSGTEFMNNDGTITTGIAPEQPTIELEPEQLQALADELANVGYKPQKGFLEGKLEATEAHLKDVRTLLKLK